MGKGLLCAGQLLPLFHCWQLLRTAGRFFNQFRGAKSPNSGDASPSNANPYADPPAHPAKSPCPSPLPRLQPGAPQALLHPCPHPLWHSLHLPHACVQHLHWYSHQVFDQKKFDFILTFRLSVVMVGVKTRVRKEEQHTATNIMVNFASFSKSALVSIQ